MDALALENARALLGVSEHADDVTINRACRHLSLSSHPDRGGSTAKQQRINGARDLLIADLQRLPPSGQPPAGPGGVAGGSSSTRAQGQATGGRAEEEDGPDDVGGGGEAEAEAEDRSPEGRGSPKRKRKPNPDRAPKKSGAARRAIKAAQEKGEEEGGYVDRGRRVFKELGGALASGTKRTCMADALWVLLQDHECTAMLEDVRISIMPDNPDENTLFGAAATYAATLGFELKCVSKEFQQTKGGYALNLLSRDHGSFLVQLRVTTGPTDLEPDLHVVAYDGKTVRDNNRYTKVKILELCDRTKEGARLVFDSLFEGLEVRIKNIYELRKMGITPH